MRRKLDKLWKKLKVLKAKAGFYGDLAVFALVFWTIKTYVPLGDTIIKVLTYLFAGMVLFSVFFVIYAKYRLTEDQ